MSERPQNKHLRPAKKGEVRNPLGRPKSPPEVIEARKLTKNECALVINKFLGMTREQIQKHLQSPEATMTELLLGGIIVKGAKDSDHTRANFILERIIGKVKDELQVEMDSGPQVVITLPDNGRTQK